LLIVTYDEHGGCYDHVAPPSGAVPPDDTPGEFGFDFKRFGIRVPAVLISPLIAPGTVFRVPEGTMPIDHTSILKTIEKRWNLPALTARDAAAQDLGDVLTRTAPRTDDPLKGVKVPKPTGKDPAKGQPSHLQKVHTELVSRLPVEEKHCKGIPHISELRTGADHQAYVQKRTAAWKKSSKTAASGTKRSAKKVSAKKSARGAKKAKKKS
jgi:phospholipase C